MFKQLSTVNDKIKKKSLKDVYITFLILMYIDVKIGEHN